MRALALSCLMLVTSLGLGSSPAPAADGSVRFLTAGPVRIPVGGSAETRLLLPAVRRGRVQATFVGEDGQVLARAEVEPPPGHPGPFFPVSFHLALAPGPGRLPVLSITDGTSNTIFAGESNGIIAILIGLLLPAVQTPNIATLQMFDAQGQTVFILPYIEQDNLRR
jgi:hypothetical protein